MNDHPTKILLIEDNAGDARLVREALAEAGAALFELAWRKDLSKGLAHLQKARVDAILLDLTLPDSRGFSTFEKVHEQAPQAAILLLTGPDDEVQSVRAMREGAQDYLVKGQVSGSRLVRSIRNAIERKQVERQLTQSNDRYRQLFENSGTGVIIVDENGRYILANKIAAANLGKTPDEVIGGSMLDFLSREQAEKYLDFNRNTRTPSASPQASGFS